MFGRGYQGNAWWMGMGVLSLLMLWHVLWTALHRRRAGVPVDVPTVAGWALLCTTFIAQCVFQVLTHDR